jgi:hypothetical protein
MVYMIEGEAYYHISDFAAITKHTIPAIRYLCFSGGRRQLKYRRDGSRILIPASEVTEYPFTQGGRSQHLIYHYRATLNGYEKYMCRACSFKEDPETCPEARRMYGLV